MINKRFGLILLVICDSTFGLEFNRRQQNYNSNADFLLHESGSNPSAAKRDYVAPSSQTASSPSAWSQNPAQSPLNKDYNAQFPSLGPTTSRPASPSGKRDYVAPQRSTSGQPQTTSTTRAGFTPGANTQSPSGKRDYVAAQFPALRVSQGQSQTTSTTNAGFSPASGNTQSSGKRDYVAPQYPALRPQGNVKDLINFYDSKNTDTSKAPSYSSILQSGTNKPGTPSTRPSSYSSAATWSTNSVTTPKTGMSFTTPLKPSTPSSSATNRPGSSVLPSSIANRVQGQTSTSNTATDAELQTLSEELLSKDTNNAARYITINYQGKVTSQSDEDKAPLPLMTLGPEVWNIPTIQKFVPLLDNYERDTLVNEHVTPQEKNEENAFMDAIMSTSVIRHLMNFLKDKGYVAPDPDPQQQREFLKQMWFGMYSRGQGKISSSGFEHVFVSELKNGEVIGLHNWIYFAKEEAANRINYMGYKRYSPISNKGAIVKLRFTQQGVSKPVNSMFIGTSPELEMALYTLCFVTRLDTECKLKLGGNDVDISTYKFRYRSKNYIGAAFPIV